MLRTKIVRLALIVTSALTALGTAFAGLPGAAAAQSAAVQDPAPVTAPLYIPSYVDNRSDAVNLLISFFNALNRQEYARAYSYWEAGSPVGTFAAFQAGYASTQTIIVTTGAVGGDAGAGQRYFIVPVTLQATTTGGPQTFVGCYVLHLALPELQAVPPFHGLGIHSANIVPVPNGANADTLRAQACTAAGLDGTSPVTIVQTPGAPESGAQFYIDSRSGALEVLQSLFNALNRHEYARAYGYWESNVLPSFSSFQQGYANTQSVQWTYGPLSSDAGAGQFYYSVPVTLRAQTTAGLQTFVGCYVLHLANPGIQADPPYQPLSIHSASVAQVFNNADTNALMAQACQNPAPQPPPVNGAPIHVSFALGSTSATLTGSLTAGGLQEYRLFAGARALLLVDLQAVQPNAYLQILAGPSGQLIGQTAVGVTHWQGTLPATREYWVRVVSNGSPVSGYNLILTIPRRVSFARGAFSGSVYGSVAAGGINSYVLRAAGGQTMTASLSGQSSSLWLEIYGLSDGQPLVRASANAATWTGVLPSNQDYIVKVVSSRPQSAYYLNVTIH